MTDEQNKAVNEIMDWFDFEKVHKTMRVLRWKWSGTEEGVPLLGEIKQRARQLLVQSIEENTTISTGGFRATYSHYENHLNLEFILSECESYIE